jgi:hypothetical protein
MIDAITALTIEIDQRMTEVIPSLAVRAGLACSPPACASGGSRTPAKRTVVAGQALDHPTRQTCQAERQLRDACRVKDWVAWHHDYDDPSSPLARRLQVVQRRLEEVLDRLATRVPRLLSLCAGDGRDVIPVLARAAQSPVRAVLVEKDRTLARRARETIDATALETVEARCGDAGDPTLFHDVLPVDVLLLCGIFGNIEHVAVQDMIAAIPSLVVSDGYVIWTRGGSDPDRRGEVRRWFRAAGHDEVAFDGAPEPYGVGVNQIRLPPAARHMAPPDRLFTFM